MKNGLHDQNNVNGNLIFLTEEGETLDVDVLILAKARCQELNESAAEARGMVDARKAFSL